jgi:hypothetical protein
MRHAPSTMMFLHGYRPLAPAGGIEWEELPSLASSIGRPFVGTSNGPWDSTRPAALDPTAAPSQPFREPLQGVAIREVTEPDIFRHFFGS